MPLDPQYLPRCAPDEHEYTVVILVHSDWQVVQHAIDEEADHAAVRVVVLTRSVRIEEAQGRSLQIAVLLGDLNLLLVGPLAQRVLVREIGNDG